MTPVDFELVLWNWFLDLKAELPLPSEKTAVSHIEENFPRLAQTLWRNLDTLKVAKPAVGPVVVPETPELLPAPAVLQEDPPIQAPVVDLQVKEKKDAR